MAQDPRHFSDVVCSFCARVVGRGQRVSACAGALVGANPTSNLLTRMQSWDYRLGINGVKGMQAAYNSALVAEGAFSAFRVDDVRDVGGWPATSSVGSTSVLKGTCVASWATSWATRR